MAENPKPKQTGIKSHKMPEQSTFFDKIVPILFIVLGIITVLLILFAIGVLTGLIQWT